MLQSSAFAVHTWKGQLGYDESKFSFPAHIVCIRYPNNKCVSHISCKCESVTQPEEERYLSFFSINALKAACRVNSISWTQDQTRAFVYSTVNTLNAEVLGRSGLGVEYTPSGYFLLARTYDDAMNWGGWGNEAKNLYVLNNWYHMDIWGADYS